MEICLNKNKTLRLNLKIEPLLYNTLIFFDDNKLTKVQLNAKFNLGSNFLSQLKVQGSGLFPPYYSKGMTLETGWGECYD
jgi:hypothetical protein